MTPRDQRKPQLYEQARHMIRETELALLVGLRHPERATRIPTIEVGTGAFDSGFADRFWSEVLDLDKPRTARHMSWSAS